MMYEFPNQGLPVGPTIATLSIECLGAEVGSSVQNYASAAYPAANRAYYIPFHLDEPILVTKLFCANGATVSGNVDMGIYDSNFTRIVSIGSTVQAGTSALQAFDITDTLIGPGDFYLAIALDNATGTIYNGTNPTLPVVQAAGILMQASAFPLPANATPVTSSATTVPLVGLRTKGTAL